MLQLSRYRSLLAAGFGVLLFATAGCGSEGTDHNLQVKSKMKNDWQMARVNIVFQLATQQYQAGEYDKCRDTLAQAMVAGYTPAPLCILAAKLEIEKGNMDVAYTHLKDAMISDPNNPEGLYLMGVVYQRWQKNEQALDNYRQAWELKPSEPGYLLATVEMLLTLGRSDEAQKLLADKLDYFEQTAAIRVALAKIYSLKHDYATAAKYYRDAVILSPDDLALRMSYGEALYFSGKFTDAIPVLEDLRRNDATPDKTSVTMLLGRSYLAMQRNRDARICFQDLTQADASNVVAWLSLGQVYLQDNEPMLAIESSQRVLKINANNVQAMIIKALAEQEQKRWEDSTSTLEGALAVSPRDATVLCMLGISTQKQGDKEKAIVYYEQAVGDHPKDTWAAELLSGVKPTPVKFEQPAEKPQEPKVEAPAVEEPLEATSAAR